MREKMLFLGQRLAFIPAKTWGPGRVDTFNAPKALLNFPMDKADPRETLGNSDFPSIWNQGPREGMQLHWDGNNTSVNERNLSAAFGTGAYPPTLDAPRVLRTAKWLLTAKPLPYPYPIDSALAEEGSAVYAQYCLNCHGTRDAPFKTSPRQRVGTVDPIGHIKNGIAAGSTHTPIRLPRTRALSTRATSESGASTSLIRSASRIFTRHRAMPIHRWTESGCARPTCTTDRFQICASCSLRGRSAARRSIAATMSTIRGTWALWRPSPGRTETTYFFFDTSMRGNGNQGHEGEEYGTSLPDDKKNALIEYLKTF